METNIDWQAIKDEFEVGVLSSRVLGTKYGISHSAVLKRAKTESWKRGSAESQEPPKKAEKQKVDSTDEVGMQRKVVEDAEAELAGIRDIIEIVQSRENAWRHRIKDLETLRLETMAEAFENYKVRKESVHKSTQGQLHLDLVDINKQSMETISLQQNLKAIPKLQQRYCDLEREAHAKVQEERSMLEKIESKIEYCNLRDNLVENPRNLMDAESQRMRMAAVRSSFRDDYDKIMFALERFFISKRIGEEKDFVWPELASDGNK